MKVWSEIETHRLDEIEQEMFTLYAQIGDVKKSISIPSFLVKKINGHETSMIKHLLTEIINQF